MQLVVVLPSTIITSPAPVFILVRLSIFFSLKLRACLIKITLIVSLGIGGAIICWAVVIETTPNKKSSKK